MLTCVVFIASVNKLTEEREAQTCGELVVHDEGTTCMSSQQVKCEVQDQRLWWDPLLSSVVGCGLSAPCIEPIIAVSS